MVRGLTEKVLVMSAASLESGRNWCQERPASGMNAQGVTQRLLKPKEKGFERSNRGNAGTN